MPGVVSVQGLVILCALGAAVCFGIFASWAIVLARLFTGVPVLPNRGAPVVSWNGMAFVGAILALVGLMVLTEYGFRSLVPREGKPTSLDLMATSSLQSWAFLLVLPLLLRPWTRRPWGELGFRWEHAGSDAMTGVVAALFFAPIGWLIQFIAVNVWEPEQHDLQKMLMEGGGTRVLLLAFVVAVVFAPLAEEILFRGIFQGWLERLGRYRIGTEGVEREGVASDDVFSAIETRSSLFSAMALCVPALIFAAAHAKVWPSPIPLFFMALVLGMLYRRTGGLIAPIAMHATFNALPTVLLIVAAHYELIPRSLREEVIREAPEVVKTAAPANVVN